MSNDDHETIESLRAALAAAEARASLAEERAAALEDLIALVPGIVVEYESQGGPPFRPTFVGGAGVQQMLGYSTEDALADAMFFTNLIPEEEREKANREAMAFLENGESHLSPHRMLRKDGSMIWVDAHFMFTPGENGAPSKLHTVVFDVTRRMQAELEAREVLAKERALRQRLDGFVANVPGIVWETYFASDPEKQQVDYVSDRVETMSGYTADDWRSPNFWLDIIPPEDREQAQKDTQTVMQAGRGTTSHRWITKDGRTIWVNSQMSIIYDEAGAPIGLRGVTMDVTDVRQAEAARAEARLKEEVIRAQEESLLALSTPLVPIDDDLLAMTLVGGLDERRADRVLSTLLEGVTKTGARTVILDVTGVPEVDTQTADAVLKAAKAVSLLGAEVVLTGIRPEVARTLVMLGADLGSIVTKGTLKAGIAHALATKNGGAKPSTSKVRR